VAPERIAFQCDLAEEETVALDPHELRELAQRYTEAWCSQHPERVAAHYAPAGSLTINDGAASVGRGAITESARSFMVAFPDMQVLMDDVRLEGDGAEYHWTLVGTNTGPGGAGKRVRISGYEEWTIGDDGLIAASLGHFDQAEYDRQLEYGVESSRTTSSGSGWAAEKRIVPLERSKPRSRSRTE
jgi:uncharacterized protein (TIGR02246 family)